MSQHIARTLRDVGAASMTVEYDNPFHIGGSLDDALRAFFGCPYTIYFGKTYRSEWSLHRSGSQRWHADGGPGSCVIVLVYHSDVGDLDGPFEWISWKRSLGIFRREPLGVSRDELCDFYDLAIDRYNRVLGPAGTAVLFSNNVLHRGGFPHPGHDRLVTVYHCYPSRRGSTTNIPAKVSAYPADPDI